MKFIYTFIIAIVLVFTSCTKESFIQEPISIDPIEIEPIMVNVVTNENESDLFKLINNYRLSIGKDSLTFNSETYIAASEHTAYMISKGKISHDNFNERATKIAKKTKAKNISENVAKNYASNQETLEAWLDSPTHRKNIEGNYTNTAISIQQNEDGKEFITQIFYN